MLPAFQDVVEGVLGESINPEHPKGSYIAKWRRLVEARHAEELM